MVAQVNFSVTVDGKTLEIKTEADLLRVRNYVDDCLTWLKSPPRFYIPEASEVTKTQDNQDNETTKKPPFSRWQASPTEKKYTTVEFALLALSKLYGTSTISEAFHTAKSLGWTTQSKNEENALRTFTIMVRQSSQLVTVRRGQMTITEEGKARADALKGQITFENMTDNQYALPQRDKYTEAEIIEAELLPQQKNSSYPMRPVMESLVETLNTIATGR